MNIATVPRKECAKKKAPSRSLIAIKYRNIVRDLREGEKNAREQKRERERERERALYYTAMIPGN